MATNFGPILLRANGVPCVVATDVETAASRLSLHLAAAWDGDGDAPPALSPQDLRKAEDLSDKDWNGFWNQVGVALYMFAGPDDYLWHDLVLAADTGYMWEVAC